MPVKNTTPFSSVNALAVPASLHASVLSCACEDVRVILADRVLELRVQDNQLHLLRKDRFEEPAEMG